MEAEYTSPDQIPFQQYSHIGHGAVGVVDELRVKNDESSIASVRQIIQQRRDFGISPEQLDKLETVAFVRKNIELSRNPRDRRKELDEIETEVAALRELRHQHTAQLVTAYLLRGKRDQFHIIMLPRAEENLDDFMTNPDNEGQSAQDKIFLWLRCLMNAVTYVHEYGLRHRDIKPTNLLIDGKNILITDFGISMMSLGITVPTTIVGRPRSHTPDYCSPDVLAGHTRGRSGDIFSLGAVFLEMLAAQVSVAELDNLRKSLVANGRQSYAMCLDTAVEFMDSLSSKFAAGSWQSELLFLCRKMLQVERSLRPTADEVRLWWSLQSPLTGSVVCGCAPVLNVSEQPQPGGVDEELRNAYKRGYPLVVDLLKRKGASVSTSDALVAACEGGHVGMVKDLVGESSCAETTGALQAACAGGHKEVAEFLLDKGASIDGQDEKGWTGLHAAASRGEQELVQMLVQRGANADLRAKDGTIAVQQAVMNEHDEVILLLMVHRIGPS